ncbi:MAG: 4Fe-4S binding protein [Candidatus Omnitrophica bacterium]|nr:4Fe-4S binding protein [Candidatus Omnitrophota bacterium]
MRRASQVFFFGLFVYILWSTTYPLTGSISPEWIFKLDPLVMIFTAIAERVLLAGLIFAGGMLVLTWVLGRFFCGWVCPLGAVIDAVGAVRGARNGLSDRANRWFRRPKLVFLLLIAVLAAAGIQAAWFLDPIVVAARFVSMNLIPTSTLLADRFFVFTVQKFNLYDSGFYDLYRTMKSDFLGVKVAYFKNALPILGFFVAATLPALFVSRFWCRAICPLGALYGQVARGSLLRRQTEDCKSCGVCRSACRMGAIREDFLTVPGECILCMDCVYDCRAAKTRFGWGGGAKPDVPASSQGAGERSGGITRKEFLWVTLAAGLFSGFRGRHGGGGAGKHAGAKHDGSCRNLPLRPPGVADEGEFVDRCIRCGNCMKVCVTNGLQPVMFEEGWEAMWTPKLVPEIGCCEYQCNLCSQVCPTGAIPKMDLETKKKARLGIAEIDQKLCVAYSENKTCIVCEEHCPISEKAIKFDEVFVDGKRILKPWIDEDLCVGCGICQHVCPVTQPSRAVRVFARKRHLPAK